MDKVDIIYITFDDINIGKKTGTADNLSTRSNWVPVERTDTYINIGNSASIQ